jgi:hypothetical protein
MPSFSLDTVWSATRRCILLGKPLLHSAYYIPYPREKGPMGGAPYSGSELGGGPIFQVSVSQLHSKERPGKLPTRSS